MRHIHFIPLLLMLLLPACGVRVPQINEAWQPADVDDDLIYRIVKSIRCEIITASREFHEEKYTDGPRIDRLLPDDWGVQFTLTLTADEKSSVNPSGSYNRNISSATDILAPGGKVAQSLILPFSVGVSSQAVRTDTYYFFYTVPELVRQRALPTECGEWNPVTKRVDLPLDRSGSSYLLSGQLGVRSWMSKALAVNRGIPQSKSPAGKNLQVLQYQIKFVVDTLLSANPMWKLAAVSTGVGGQPLFSADRTRTHDMLLTLGPTDVSKGGVVPVGPAVALHTTGQFEQAVSNGFRQALGR